MFVQTAYFLFLVPVAVFLPGFSRCCFWSSFSWANRSTAWLVAHDRLNPLGERPYILLKREFTSINMLFHNKWPYLYIFLIFWQYISTIGKVFLQEDMRCIIPDGRSSCQPHFQFSWFSYCLLLRRGHSNPCLFSGTSCAAAGSLQL